MLIGHSDNRILLRSNSYLKSKVTQCTCVRRYLTTECAP